MWLQLSLVECTLLSIQIAFINTAGDVQILGHSR